MLTVKKQVISLLLQMVLPPNSPFIKIKPPDLIRSSQHEFNIFGHNLNYMSQIGIKFTFNRTIIVCSKGN